MGQDRVGGMRVQIDNAALLAVLPLAPGARVTIPILLHAAQVRPRPAMLAQLALGLVWILGFLL